MGADTPTVVNVSSRLRAQDGLSLIEVLVACFVLLIGIMSTLVLMDAANRTTVKTRAREGGINLTRELVEGARSVPYANVTPGSIVAQLQSQPGLADAGVGAGWTIRRRNITYTVTATVCTMDDARDGGGTHTAGGFCADSVAQNTPDATTGSTDKAPEDYKRVRVQATWQQGNSTREAHQTTIINNPGSAGGPAVRTLTLGGSASPPAVTTGSSLNFVLTTSSTPTTLHWLLDGADQAPITAGGGLTWNFDWNLGAAGSGGNPDPAGSAVDGTYIVSAEAFDMYNVAGPSRSLTVTLNRSAPDKVADLAGGRNGAVVDLEWSEVGERDIIGYQVFRKVGGSEIPIPSCPMSTTTSCTDTSPPAAPGNVDYVVYAYDLDSAGVQRKGPVASDVLTVTSTNNPPFTPLSFTATRNVDDTTALAWTKPSPADPDNDPIDFYRIYRDGTGIADRYARWDNPNTNVTFVDAATDGQAHCYWVTAVDRYYAESPITPQRCA